MSHVIEQKTIAKNTIFLYLRMFVVMIVSFYTSRVVLDKLGVDDYGIYNIVGSVVVSFVFIKNALQSATQRFLSYTKGLGERCSKVFSTSMNIHLTIMFIVVVVLETAGLWFFNNVIQIPFDRREAAQIVYQISILTFCVNLLQVPYTSVIVSNEKMSIYAYISIIEVIMKLVIVYALTVSQSIDKLILYACLMLLVTFLQLVITGIYCKLKLTDDSNYQFCFDKKQFKEMLSFSTWNLVGGVSGVACTEGPNYFMNVYLGVKVNAAMGIAKQVSNIVYGFSSNFQNAFNPQIVKSYASKDLDYMNDLIFRTSKLSFFLIYVISAPLIVCCEDVLNVWLTVVPEYTTAFCIWILVSQLVAAISSPFWMAAHAIGNIRKYQMALVYFNLSIIPVAWGVLGTGCEPYWIIVYQVVMNIGIMKYRVSYLKSKVDFPAIRYYKDVVMRCLVVIPVITLPILYTVHSLCKGFSSIILTSFVAILIITILFAYIGLSKMERNTIINIIKKKVSKHE